MDFGSLLEFELIRLHNRSLLLQNRNRRPKVKVSFAKSHGAPTLSKCGLVHRAPCNGDLGNTVPLLIHVSQDAFMPPIF